MFIDTHCHLDFDSFDDDLPSVIQRALENQVSAIITIGTDIKSSERAISIAEQFSTVFAAVGIHPTDCQHTTSDDIKIIEDMLSHQKVVAVGEIGLDYYHMRAEKEKQIQVFSQLVALAKDKHFPVIIHNREAHSDMLALLDKLKPGASGGVMHSFSGDSEYLQKVIELNLFISFTGNITFKNAKGLDLVSDAPIDKMLLETDSPFLTPMPFRGKRNEPGFITYTARKIAETKNLSLEKVAQITTSNAKSLFKLQI